MAKGNWRNWDRTESRPVVCPWCGWQWKTIVPVHPVCPKCQLNTHDAASLHPLSKEQMNDHWILHKTAILKDHYRKHPEELRKKK